MDQSVTTKGGRIIRNAAQGPDLDPDDGSRVAVPQEGKPPVPDPVTITHADGRTATVSPKVADFLTRNDGWTLDAPKAKGKAAPKPKADAQDVPADETPED